MTPTRAAGREMVAKEVRTILSRWIMLDRNQLELDLVKYIDAALQAERRATEMLAQAVMDFHVIFRRIGVLPEDPETALIEGQMRKHAVMVRLAAAALARQAEEA